MKCVICDNAPADVVWLPWTDGDPLTFAAHYEYKRMLPGVRVCSFCQHEYIPNTDAANPVRFHRKGTEYIWDGSSMPYCTHLWDGGTSDDGYGQECTMLCRDTPTGHDIVALVYDAKLAAIIIDAYNQRFAQPQEVQPSRAELDAAGIGETCAVCGYELEVGGNCVVCSGEVKPQEVQP